MTTDYHTPPVDGAPANMSVIRAPLAELDAAIGNLALTEKDGHIVQEEGTDLAQQQRLNFVGASVTAENDAGNLATKVTIDGSNWAVNAQTLSATLVLTDASSPIQILNPNGANRVVTLPAAGANNHRFIFVNTDPTYTIDVQKADTTSLLMIVDSRSHEVVSNKSSNWYAEGFDNSTDKYTFSLSIASNNLTVALKRYDGTDPSAAYPLKILAGTSILSITSALSVTITAAMADIFTWDSRKIQGNDAQLFVYLINNNGTAELGAAPNPNLVTVATTFRDAVGQTGSVTQDNIVMSGTRHATNTCVVIGRVNVNQTDANNWQAPTVSNIINHPIFETDWLTWSAALTGYSSNPTSAVYQYKVSYHSISVKIREGSDGTSNATNLLINLPYTAATITNMLWSSLGIALDNSVPLTSPSRLDVASAGAVLTCYPTHTSLGTWTASGGKRIAIGSIDYQW